MHDLVDQALEGYSVSIDHDVRGLLVERLALDAHPPQALLWILHLQQRSATVAAKAPPKQSVACP
jgi:hypothetical protein